MVAQAHFVKDIPAPTPEWAFAAYQKIRNRLPQPQRQGATRSISSLSDIAEDFDLILFDAYGVLTVGERAIPGAAEMISALRARGKQVMVVSNSAGYPKSIMMQRYSRLGFDFTPEEVVSSREAMLAALPRRPGECWGAMAEACFDTSDLQCDRLQLLADDPEDYVKADRFMLIGSGSWTARRQGLLVSALRDRPRPVIVGNPDLVAPREAGFTLEPGYFAHRLAEIDGVEPDFFGKPFSNIFELALSRIAAPPPPERTLMVGDTLHTDILGGNQMGLRTALMTGFGALKGLGVSQACEDAGIFPDYVL